MSGVPPDAFSDTGQRWGNPLYDWDKLKARGYDWWIERMRWAVETCDIVRLDHFRGFEAYWEIPADEETAIHGHWAPGPNEDLFKRSRNALGKLPFIAEDLGYITPEVSELRKKLDIPGMKVMQFGFGDRGAHIYLPHMLQPIPWSTPGPTTTTPHWAGGKYPPPKPKRHWAIEYLGNAEDGITGHSFALPSPRWRPSGRHSGAGCLGLDRRRPHEIPSKPGGNWSWRLTQRCATSGIGRQAGVPHRGHRP